MRGVQVYRGKVSNVMDFGAFVELQGMRQRAEGLVHVSEISKTRANSAREVLNRGQECWVKVMRVSTVGGKQQLSLSMRDVDQVWVPNMALPQHWPCLHGSMHVSPMCDGKHAAALSIIASGVLPSGLLLL